jgi:hypothetical protein
MKSFRLSLPNNVLYKQTVIIGEKVKEENIYPNNSLTLEAIKLIFRLFESYKLGF